MVAFEWCAQKKPRSAVIIVGRHFTNKRQQKPDMLWQKCLRKRADLALFKVTGDDLGIALRAWRTAAIFQLAKPEGIRNTVFGVKSGNRIQ